MSGKAPEGLQKHAKGRTAKVVADIKRAMVAMEKEVRANDDIYPVNRGRLSMAEVCRRAGVHPITLNGPLHVATHKQVQDWLSNMEVIQGSREIRSAVTKRAVDAREEYRRIASQFQAMYQVEMPKRDDEIERLRRSNVALTEEIARLRAQSGDARVVPLPSTRPRRR